MNEKYPDKKKTAHQREYSKPSRCFQGGNMTAKELIELSIMHTRKCQ